ncbi:hypothetical protein MKZ38_006024 [Zalerion maritima]|uniref:Uncharacterized protein n=1 Tax=Zalerion maritima TaxID=339359 RepID=A0AAD5RPG5_9PEZI|nr:hypothetical protein MKZ38_006024 [Zalerion maritima]
MGVESKRIPPLPAPTETESNAPSEPHSDIETDVTASHTGDEKSSYSLPDDGTPVTIKTRGHKHTKSQTSLLIEYFENGKAGPSTAERKPSVRVRLTPSSKSRENDHHIRITKTKNSRKVSKRKRVSQAGHDENDENVDLDISYHASATEESNVSRPIDVEIDRSNRRPRRPASPLIPGSAIESSRGSYLQSEISAIPTDSFLDGGSFGRSDYKGGIDSSFHTDSQAGGGFFDKMPREKTSSGRDRDRATVSKPRDRDRDKDRERERDRGERERKHKSSSGKSRSSSVSERHADGIKSPRRSSRSHQESVLSAADSSVLSSQVSASQHSKLSGTSKASGTSSINNPKLLETVEDAIRRLILPELNALKREQSQKGPRSDSLTASSVTNTSRDSRDSRDDRSTRRRSSRSAASRDTSRYHESRNREARNDLEEGSPRDAESDSIDLRMEDYGTLHHNHDELKAGSAGAALGAAGAMVASSLDGSPSDVSKRRRRRSEKKLSSKSRDRIHNDEDGLEAPPPPMPLSSEVYTDLTRTSILSADTDRPHSATEELTPVHEVSRGVPSVDSTPTPSGTPKATIEQLGAAHANISHGDLKQLPSRRTREFPSGIEGPVQPEEEEYDEEEFYQDRYPEYYDQDVPAPLNYTPYQPASRGLSPIESVSGYTDAHSEVQQHRDSRLTQTTGSYSPEKPEEGISNISAPSNVRSHGFEDSEVGSLRSSGVDAYRNSTYTNDSELDRVQSGQAVQQVGANPDFVNSPVGIESNVASLVEGSVVEPSVLSTGYNQQQRGSQESMTSLEEHRPRSAADARGMSPSSRGMSPGSPSVASRRQLFEERMGSPASRKSNLSREYQEYEPDQYGRKVPMTANTRQSVESPTPSETAITGAAVGAAAAALRAAQGKHHDTSGTDIVRNKSFKERAQTRQPAATPKHSVDRFSFEGSPTMEATAGPDMSMPEVGYGLEDHSMVDEPLGHEHSLEEEELQQARSANATPTPSNIDRSMNFGDYTAPAAAAAAGAGAGAGAAAGAVYASHSRQPSQDPSEDFRRTSQDRKRETIITNPYENASPVPILGDANEQMLGGSMANQYGAPPFPSGTPGLAGKVDEGYISQGPNRTPDMQVKGKGVDFMDQNQFGGPVDDPFGGNKNHSRHLSGMSQGMASPFYDAATGTGIDRIESKDIVALMQHLMVRDAQRSARDTEILVTLVRTAADMRNSFDAVTKLLGDVENTIITEVQDNTDKTVRTHLGGPRPYPGSVAPRSVHNGSQAGTDEAAVKKRNFLQKALKGLSMKGNNDLGRIEDMLMQLLSEVDVLKARTVGPAGTRSTVHEPSFDNLQPEVQYEQDRGYEPEGMAGTSTTSHGSQSGHLSLPQRGPSAKLGYDRKFSAENRISTVHEHEDEYEDQPPTPRQDHYANPDMLMTPTRDVRGSSVPLATPPQTAHGAAGGSMSQENTPKEKGKKHKSSSSSSWFPKISRWSETTASSVGNKFRMSGSSKRNQSGDLAQQPASRSGSELGQYDADGFLRTDPNGDDRVQMQTGYSDQGLTAPLIPPPHPGTYMTPEDPKYHAHRNSLNLQHPQPRPGNTEKYKLALETSAQDFEPVPMSPRSGNWGGSVNSLNRLAEEPPHYADGSHEAAAGQEFWSPTSPSSGGPPRPPKQPLDYDGLSTPAKGSRISKLQQQTSPLPYHSVESGYGTATTGAGYGSPKYENRHLTATSGVPTRRPSGPRAMTPKNDSSPDGRKKRDTFGTVGSQDSETF